MKEAGAAAKRDESVLRFKERKKNLMICINVEKLNFSSLCEHLICNLSFDTFQKSINGNSVLINGNYRISTMHIWIHLSGAEERHEDEYQIWPVFFSVKNAP